MANEFSISLYVGYDNGNAVTQISPGAINVDQTTPGYIDRTMALTTSYSTLDIGDIGTSRFLYFRHVDSSTAHALMAVAGYTSTGGATNTELSTIKKNDVAWLPMKNAADLKFKASSGTLKIKTIVFEA